MFIIRRYHAVILIAVVIVCMFLTVSCSNIKIHKTTELGRGDVTSKDEAVENGKVVDKMGMYWLDKIEKFAEDNEKRDRGGIVLLGDSITEGFPVDSMFPDMNVISRGISGDKIGGWKYLGVIDRLEVSVFSLKPRKLFLLIGINDIIFWDTPPEEMAAGYDRLLSLLKGRCENCTVYIQSLLPLRGKYAKHNEEASQFNKKIRELAQQHNFAYLNVRAIFCDEKGELREELTYDGLHLNEAGYKEWKKILLPLF